MKQWHMHSTFTEKEEERMLWELACLEDTTEATADPRMAEWKMRYETLFQNGVIDINGEPHRYKEKPLRCEPQATPQGLDRITADARATRGYTPLANDGKIEERPEAFTRQSTSVCYDPRHHKKEGAFPSSDSGLCNFLKPIYENPQRKYLMKFEKQLEPIYSAPYRIPKTWSATSGEHNQDWIMQAVPTSHYEDFTTKEDYVTRDVIYNQSRNEDGTSRTLETNTMQYMPRTTPRLLRSEIPGLHGLTTEEIDKQVLELHKPVKGHHLLAPELHDARNIAKQQQQTAIQGNRMKCLSRSVWMYPPLQYDAPPI